MTMASMTLRASPSQSHFDPEQLGAAQSPESPAATQSEQVACGTGKENQQRAGKKI